ncbi:hypothetical protein Tco_1351623 [Tanacetum coccineum]
MGGPVTAMHFMKIGVALKKLVIHPKSPIGRRLTKEDMIKEEVAARCCAHQRFKQIKPVGLELAVDNYFRKIHLGRGAEDYKCSVNVWQSTSAQFIAKVDFAKAFDSFDWNFLDDGF